MAGRLLVSGGNIWQVGSHSLSTPVPGYSWREGGAVDARKQELSCTMESHGEWPRLKRDRLAARLSAESLKGYRVASQKDLKTTLVGHARRVGEDPRGG